MQLEYKTCRLIQKCRNFNAMKKKNTWRKIGNIGWSALGRQNPGMRIGPPCKAITQNTKAFTTFELAIRNSKDNIEKSG